MAVFKVPSVPPQGLHPLLSARNGGIPSGPSLAYFDAFVNMVAYRRLKILFARTVSLVTGGAFGSSTTIRGRFMTSPYCTGVDVLVLSKRAGSATVHGNATITVGGVAQPTLYWSGQSGFATAYDDLVVTGQAVVDGSGDPITGNQTLDLSMTTTGTTIGVIFYERQPVFGPSSGFNFFPWAIGAPVLDSTLSGITDKLWNIHKQQGPRLISWSEDGYSGTTRTVTGTTWTNLMDGSVAGWASTANGFWIWPRAMGTLSATTCSVQLWCYGSATNVNGGSLRFLRSGATIGTITNITNVAGYFTATGTISTANDSDLVTVEAVNTTAGQATTINAFGMYALTT